MNTTFMPSVRKSGEEKAPVSTGSRLALLKLIIGAGWQKRNNMVVHGILIQAAQARADDMARRGYFGHTSPDGVTPNEWARRSGYRLPDWYSQKGNNIESLLIGSEEPEDVIKAWFDSPRHHDHLVGEGSFYGFQNALGVGFAKAKDGRTIWVFLSAPDMG